MIEIFNNIFFLIFGSLIKILDDHYDMNMFNKKVIDLIKVLIILSIIYCGSISIDYSIGFLFVSLYSYFASSIDTPSYKLGIILFGILFLVQLFFTNFNEYNFGLLIYLFIVCILSLILIYKEAKLYNYEYNKDKIISRIFLSFVFICLFLLDLEELNNNFNFNFLKENKIIQDVLEMINDKVFKNCYIMLFGYFFTSVLDMSYMYNKNINK
jgi:hypothetical protein